MPSIADCIVTAREGGEIDPIRADEALRTFEELVARYETKMPRAAAEAQAAADLKVATRKAARSRFHAVVNQLQAATRIRQAVETAQDPFEAVMGLLEWREGRSTSAESVMGLKDAYERSFNFEIRDALQATAKNLIGQSRDKPMLRDIVRELHGQASGNAPAKALADAVRSQQERARQLFNAHGGDVGKLDHYGLRHTHDAAKVREAGREAWKRFLLNNDLVDWTRIDDVTTGRPFAEAGGKPDPAAADRFLDEVYESIATEGWNKREPSFSATGKALYNRRAEARVLHFRDGDGWMTYNEAFGTQDPFSAMVGDLHVMARDVALMRVLGPNPKSGLEYAIQVAEKRAADSGDADLIERVKKLRAQAQATLAHIDGNANRPVNEAMANFFGGVRNVQTAAYLGGAILSSTTDVANMALAAWSVGMRPTGVIARHVELMASSATRETAARMGYVADTLANTGAAAARYLGDTVAPEVTATMADFTLRASGLNYWTDMARAAFQMEFAGFLAENADRAFDRIDPTLRRALEARDITPADWDKIRHPSGFFTAPNGSTFISPSYWRNAVDLPADEAEQLGMRLQMVISEQLEIAVPTGSVRMRAMLMGEARPGTPGGEIMRSVTAFRSFVMSMTLRQYDRIMAQPTVPGRVGYALTLFTMMTALGAVAVQLKQVAKGRDPVPMNTPKFALAAAFQGGGLGIFGDFFAANQNRFGGSFGETLAGPTAALIGDVGSVTVGAGMRAFRGEDTFFGRDLANLARYNTPVASSLWYFALPFHRLGFDQFQALIDPEAEQSFRNSEQRLRREGTQSFWRRGELTPDRGPDLSNALRTP